MEVKKLFGLKIREYRKRKELTQAQLAELVNIDNKHISSIELGKNFPSAELIGRFSEALGIEPKELFEFYHHQEPADLKQSIVNMLDSLNDDQLKYTFKYIRSCII